MSNRIENTVVVVGLGYVGLPLCVLFARQSLRVQGIDVDQKKISDIKGGRSPISELDTAEVQELLKSGFESFSDFSAVASADVVVLALPTPVGDNHEPDLRILLEGLDNVAAHLNRRTLIIVESTIAPGTTQNVLVPRIEAAGKTLGEDFLFAFSPERVDPGSKREHIQDIPKIVAGADKESHQRAVAFYQAAGFPVVEANTVSEAEAAKLLENTYRAVNMALVNELAPAFSAMGIDIAEVVRLAATKPFGFQPFYPGAGVGGHCIPVDPWYLDAAIREAGASSRLTQMALLVNDEMPHMVAQRIADIAKQRGEAGSGMGDVLLLGMTYKPDVDDFRESPGPQVALALHDLGLNVAYHDPYLSEPMAQLNGMPMSTNAAGDVSQYRVTVVLQNHREYEALSSVDYPALFSAMADPAGKKASLWTSDVTLGQPREVVHP